METVMVSPERLQEYIDIENETPYRADIMDPPKYLNGPSSGCVVFDNVSFRYKQGGDLVLRYVSFTMDGGQTIGIVGRTGAGISSFIISLFRINELASGVVLIDGIDVGKIGLKTLREKLSIVPQTPVLLQGPLLEYLDPFSRESIRKVGLAKHISEDEFKLMMTVEETVKILALASGRCYAWLEHYFVTHALLFFDKATAAFGHETDQKLQRVLRTKFAKATVFIIAHRLDTILDADRFLVLDGGHLVEFEPPTQLVDKGQEYFYDLMRDARCLDKVC